MDFQVGIGRVFYKDAQGKLLAEITWHPEGDQEVIDHTFVDESLRGQGVAGQLVALAVSEIRQEGKKVGATCSYAAKWLKEHA